MFPSTDLWPIFVFMFENAVLDYFSILSKSRNHTCIWLYVFLLSFDKACPICVDLTDWEYGLCLAITIAHIH